MTLAMSKLVSWLSVAILAVAVWTSLSVLVPTKLTGQITLFNDVSDFWVYFSGQGWLKPGHLLLEGGYAEYPPLALLYVILPRLVTDSFTVYSWLLWTSNAVFYGLAVWLTWRLSVSLKSPQAPAWWIWVLPSVVFYSLNRFDIFPVVLVLLALDCLIRGRNRVGWFVYGAAIMTKLYPVFLLPLFLFVAGRQSKPRWNSGVYALIPIVMFSLVMVQAGGISAALSPYLLQLGRQPEPGGFLRIVYVLWPHVLPALWLLCQFVQVLVPMGWLLLTHFKPQALSFQNHLVLASLVLLVITGFNAFYSNQWWLWVVPFLSLVVPQGKRWVIVWHDVLNYLQAPIALEVFGKWGATFNYVVLIRTFFWAVLIGILWRQLPRGWGRLI